MVVTRRSNGGKMRVKKEILRNSSGGYGSSSSGGSIGSRVVAREVVNGGAYGLQLM